MRKELKALTSLAEVFAKRKNDEGMSSKEIMKETGWGENKVREMLREALTQGKLTVGKRNEPSIDGAMRSVPVYRVSV